MGPAFNTKKIDLWLCAVALLACTVHYVPTAVASGAISQSYQTVSSDISAGALLSLSRSNPKVVELASSENAAQLVGVATKKPLLALSGNGQGSVQTTIGGTTEVLVGTVNGEVRSGDKITASPVAGIGMKATEAGEVIGVAQADLVSVSTTRKVVKNQDGSDATITVGLLPVAVNVAYYSASTSSEVAASFVPPFLQNLANGIAGKQVSPLRVLLGTITLLLGFITAMVILYAAIRNSVISLGRNPLAEKTLRKELVGVIATAVAVLVLTGAVIYIILLS